MKRLRLATAVIAAKIIYMLCRMLGSRASATPGKYARLICPDVTGMLAKQVRRQMIVVCGTNGKTTTNNLINKTLMRAGFKTVCNSAGANMLNGIAAAFCKSATILGTLKADYACIEVDEANLPLFFENALPSVIVVTNLFRDQLDRYGEIDITAKLLEKSFDMASDALFILNADDPVTSSFGEGRKAVYYGTGGRTAVRGCDEIRDGGTCRRCGEELEYEYYLYGQIGKYRCPKCGYTNPKADYTAENISIKDAVLRFDLVHAGRSFHAESEVCGLYNVYNMLMAYAALDEVGADSSFIMGVLCAQKPEPGRMSRFYIGGKSVYLMLSKNPTGFNQSVTTVINDNRKKDVMVVLNDKPQDGEDISWIWDVDFETLYSCDADSYTVTGDRRFDMYLRLKYAGYDEEKISVCDKISKAIQKMLSSEAKLCYVLVNYTATYPVYTALKELEKESGKV